MSELVEKGVKRLEWARTHMPVLAKVREELKDSGVLNGLKISMALHTEAKTGILALTLKEVGGKVRLASCNPLSTDDSVAVALNERYGLETYAKKGESDEEYYDNMNKILSMCLVRLFSVCSKVSTKLKPCLNDETTFFQIRKNN